MTMSNQRDWWGMLTAVLGALLLTMGALGAVAGGGSGDEGFAIVLGFVGGVASGALMIGGLARRRANPVSGSQLIVAGAALAMIGGLEFIPVGIVVLISGFWTGNLRLTERSDSPDLQPVRRHQIDMTRNWQLWFGASVLLFGIGWVPLIIEGDDLTWGYFIWILSWLGAMVTGAVGVILAALHLAVRHRTRLT